MFKCVHFSEYDKTDDVTPITVEEINIWKDAIMTYFKVLLPWEPEENFENRQDS